MAEQMRRVARLFGDWPETIIWTCLEGAMGDIYVDDSQLPQSALALYGRQSFFGFLAGQPHRDLLKICEGKDIILVPQNQAWSDLIEEAYGDGVRLFTRYATKKETEFDLGHLQKLVDDLPESFDMKLIDHNLYEACLVEEWSRDLVGNYIDVEQFLDLGLAKACAAQLVLACLDRGLYPSWDAHTLTSLKLAEKLGYQLDRPYQAYEWR
ncbi:TPA: GNAT family N-acetyltransferase [Streptococcus suis]|nr:GNAT family N-acetyltransferase [Streptococcus suis]HEM3622818.1 GNAT family N-acetyltransferase [Streptococcus suis]HEM3627048.1 GNAT family N-acetyltransferase [Streptococcus suis]HEM3629850.1 GNAT family N-acetyltransferase [Streptococcus suis]HEM3631728.1 GNAT family N-acetyltransferase [Streptococcus suis]